LKEVEALSGCNGLATSVGLQLAQDCRHVMIDGARRKEESPRYVRIVQTVGNEAEDLGLPRCEAGWALPRCRPWATRDPARTALSQPARDNCGRWPRA